MTKKYKMVRFPIDAYNGFNDKKNVIEGILKEEKVKKKLTYADTLRFFSQKKNFIYNDEIINFLRAKKKINFRNRIL